ncbi:hypothetical protein Ancab_036761 [Ancistrocladus abbreviatus]
MDACQWPQLKQLPPMEEVSPNTNSSRPPTTGNMLERRAASRPQKEQNLNCPRCNSTNTKFCYYNNYSLTQPRYFCKACRRYWTQGGCLRNVPVGGGSRKNKRSTPSSSLSTNTLTPSAATSSASSSTKTTSPLSTKQLIIPDLNPPTTHTQLINNVHHHQNPSKIHYRQGQDLNLAFPTTQDHYQGIFQPIELPKIEINNSNCQPISNTPNSCSSAPSSVSVLELFRSGIASRSLNPYVRASMPDSSTLYPSGFPLQELRPTLSFFGDGIGARVGNVLGVQENNGARLLFPFKQTSSTTTTEVDQTKGSNDGTPEYWNGMLGGGTW